MDPRRKSSQRDHFPLHQSSGQVKPDHLGDLGDRVSQQANQVGQWLAYKTQKTGLSRWLETGLYFLRQPSLYFYIFWAISPIFMYFERATLFQGWGWLLLLPVILSWAVLFASFTNIPFPQYLPIPRFFFDLLLFCAPFFRKINISPAQYRSDWNILGVWICLILFITAFMLKSFGLALTAVVILLCCFATLFI